MQILNKLSEKEKKLLFLLFTLIIIVAAYQFGYQTFSKIADDLNNKNEQLKTVLDEKSEKAAKKTFYEKETKSMNAEINEINSQFPSYLTQEKSTIFVSKLADYTGMKVSSIAFEDISIFYTPDGTNTINPSSTEGENTADTSGNGDSTSEEITDENGTNTSSSDAASSNESNQSSTDLKNIVSTLNDIGYKMGVTITYQMNYEGMKKCMDYIKSEGDRMNIRDISAAFDNSTGNLTGTMTIDMYAYSGSKQPYVEPDINDVEISTDNIFGTFEMPIE
jgi:hypothetical protein